MKNRLTFFIALGLLVFVAVGCGLGGLIGSDEKTSSKDSSSKSTDSGSSDSKTEKAPSGEIIEVGIPECDALATYINDNADEIGDQNIVVRGIVEMYKQTIFSNLRDSVKNMKDDEKAKMGENCKKALDNLKEQMKK